MSAARPVERSTLVFRALLLAYPPNFRREYGPEMEQVFRDCCQDALRTGGASGLASLWARTLLDLLVSAVSQRLNAGKGWWVGMQTWARIGSAALALGSVTWAVGWALAGPGGDVGVASIAAAALLLIGWTGFSGTYAARLGWPGYLGFAVGFAGLPLAALAVVANWIGSGQWEAWAFFAGALAGLTIGCTVVGLSALAVRGAGRRAAASLATGTLGLLVGVLNPYGLPQAYVGGLYLPDLFTEVELAQSVAMGLFGLSWLVVARAVWLAQAPARPVLSGTPQEALL